MTINETMAELAKHGVKNVQLDWNEQGEAHVAVNQHILTHSGKGGIGGVHHGIGADHEFAMARVLDQCKHVAELQSNIVAMGANGR